ncbi:hypothetical protein QOZ80_6BG0478450 [Eleusine coracana subsp. coracana]|nr:hypothetical protein QOZ80_6BG0478450 [Eleusine coracana subsp. coracana]
MAGSERTIVWFRRDLRIDDNPALATVAREGSVLPVFIWCPVEYGQYYPGRCSRWWLKQSLAHLGKSLESLGCPLVLIHAKESTLAALLKCVHLIGATRVVYNRLYDPISLVCDDKIKKELSACGIPVQSFNGDLLYEPWDVYDDNGHAFTNFKMYWEKCMKLSVLSPSSGPSRLIPVPGIENVHSCTIDDLGLESSKDEESSNALLSRVWSPGWRIAEKMLEEFMSSGLLQYSKHSMKYFWDVLLDANLESDILGWQYISGSLPDGHELSRLDNPEVQGQKHDPDGEYVRTWIPELARMPTEWIHRPWDAPKSILEVAGVELGFNYPKPIVELHMARDCLDDAISMMWQLDTAAKLDELNGEVVEDNMNYIKGSNIPVVVLKKELSSTVSSCGQRLLNGNGKNKLQSTEVKGPYKQIIQADVMNASNMEDTQSTANLQVSKKRFHSEGYLEQKADKNGAGKFEDDATVDSGTSTSRPSKRVA